MGWGVFPCQPGGKVPLGRLAPHGVRSATVDEVQVREWWGQEPGANVGLAVPGDHMVLDLDSRAPRVPTGSRRAAGRLWDGLEALRALEAHYGALPATATAGTPTGGRHHYLSLPLGARVGNAVGLELPAEVGGGYAACDVRTDGGYVVAPPSERPEGVYRWLRRERIAEAPAWLVELYHRAPVVEVAQGGGLAPAVMPSDPREAERVTRYRQAGLRRAIEAVLSAPQGGRHATLRDAALQVGHLLGPGLEWDQAQRELVQAGVTIYGREARAGRIGETVAWGLRAGAQEPATVPDRPREPPDPRKGAQAEAVWAARFEEVERWCR
jgi:hypothetical protein